MDYLLFEKYGLHDNEKNIVIINQALDNYRNKMDWDAKLNSKNDKIRARAKAEQNSWLADRKLLLDENKRTQYIKERNQAISEIVEYIKTNDSSEEAFAEIATIQGIDLALVKKIFERYNNIFVEKKVDLNNIYEAAFLINKTSNAYNMLVASLDASIKAKFLDYDVNVDSLYEILNIKSCANINEIVENSNKVSKLTYELYNKQLFSSEIKNAFMDIFDGNSNKDEAVIRLLQNKFINELSINNWILIKYIKITCVLMKRNGVVSEDKLSNIKQADKREFVQAMKKVFDVSFELTTENSYNSTNFQNIPDEVSKGENILKTGNFKKAEVLFNKAITMDPYCWQAYWGLFKASINAKTNEEIYFPGFIKLLRASDLLDTYPDYIDYYKSAKCYAAAQKSPEINFNAIEMEYKNADLINHKYTEQVKQIKAEYESGNPDNIKSEKGKELAKSVIENIKERDKVIQIKENGNFTNILIAGAGALLIIFAVFGALCWIFESLAAYALIIPGILGVGCGIIAGMVGGGLLGGIVVAVITAIALMFVAEFAGMLPFVVAPIYLIVGFKLFMKGKNKIKFVKTADETIEQIDKKTLEKISELAQCFFGEAENLCNTPLNRKYRIPCFDGNFDYSAYVNPEPVEQV